MGVFEGEVGETFILGNVTVADDLDFGLVRDRFQVWVEDGAFGIEGLAVAVAFGGRVEALGELTLGFWGAVRLVLENDYGMTVECVSDESELVIWKIYQ